MTAALLLLGAATLLLGYANGANDNFKAVATVYGSSTLGYRSSVVLATLAQLAGSMASLFLAGALLKAFGGKGLLPDEVVAEPRFLLAVGVGAATTVLLATRLGMPVSTTHAMIGGLLGAGLAIAPGQVLWSSLGSRFVLPLLLSPLVAAGLAALIYPAARAARRRLGVEEMTCICLAERVEPVAVTADGGLVLARGGLELTADQAGLCRQQYAGRVVGLPAADVVDWLHLGSAASLGFARGLNDTPKVMALLVAAAWSGLSAPVSLVMIAAAMAAGGILAARRVAETLGHRITVLNRGQGLIANAVGSALVIAASIFGLPVSTTHVSTGAIFGIGTWTGRARWTVMGQIIMAWLATLPLGLALGYAVGGLWP